MREFQEENERRRVTAENNSTALVNDEENQMISQSIPNQSSESSTPIIQRKYLNSDRRINIDRNKFHSKSNKTQSDSLKVAGFFLCFNLISLSRWIISILDSKTFNNKFFEWFRYESFE